jgi:hypothetical protein
MSVVVMLLICFSFLDCLFCCCCVMVTVFCDVHFKLILTSLWSLNSSEPSFLSLGCLYTSDLKVRFRNWNTLLQSDISFLEMFVCMWYSTFFWQPRFPRLQNNSLWQRRLFRPLNSLVVSRNLWLILLSKI